MFNIRISLFTKFIITMVSLAVLPVVITGWRLIDINKRGMESTILELHTHLAISLAEKITTHLSQLENQMQFVIKSITEAKGQSREILKSLLDSDENFIVLSLVNQDGDEMFKVYNEDLVKDPKLFNIKDRDIFKNLRTTRTSASWVLSPVYFENNLPRIEVLAFITPTHMIYATLSFASLWDAIEKTRIGKTGHALLVDADGSIIAHTERSRAINKENIKSVPIVKAALQSDSSGASTYTRADGIKMVGAYAPIPALKWGVIIEQDESEAYYTAIAGRRQATRLAGIVMFVGLLIAFFMARNLSRPIMHLISGAERVAAGDFTTQVHVQTRDELRDLTHTFNTMTRKLKDYADLQVDKIIAEKTKTEAIIFSIADGIVMTDHAGTIQLINSQALNIFNIKPSDTSYENKNIFDLIPQESVVSTLKELIVKPDKTLVKEIDLSVGKTSRFYTVNTGKVTALKGDELGTVTVLHDITLEKQLDNLKEEFLHTITHDLRNPMTSIRGFLRFLLDGVAGDINEQQKKMLLTMDKASDKLLMMINDILDIAKLEAGKLDLCLEQFNLADVASRMLEMMQSLAQKKNISLELIADASQSSISADQRLMERVVTNLISNAIKFTPEEGKIILEIKNEGANIRVSVKDTGEGIPSDYLDKIFDKFKQVTGQRKGGTGLGLTICKYVVELHLGTIWVESKFGEGATFIFTMPQRLQKNENGAITCAA